MAIFRWNSRDNKSIPANADWTSNCLYQGFGASIESEVSESYSYLARAQKLCSGHAIDALKYPISTDTKQLKYSSSILKRRWAIATTHGNCSEFGCGPTNYATINDELAKTTPYESSSTTSSTWRKQQRYAQLDWCKSISKLSAFFWQKCWSHK